MSNRITRRRFVYASSAAAAAAFVPLPGVSRRVLGANEKLNIASVGAGGKGSVDIGYCSGENLVAMCDVDERNAGATFAKFPQARKYKDFRVMLEKENKNIDAVTVSTPDHLHAVASVMAMKLGKNVYCQKPLTHCIYEARVMQQVARDTKAVTQMGNQGHSQSDSRRLVELVRAGVLGTVKEIHVWTDRPIWPQGEKAIAALEAGKGQSPPATLAWDLWLGPAKDRPYNAAYLPFKWRGFWDFGTGALGDMGCHNMDMSFFALELRDPTSVEAESSKRFDVTAPQWSIIKYNFPARGPRPAVSLTWYDGGKKPSPQLVGGENLPSNGCIMVGEKDTLYVPHYWGAGHFTRSGKKMADYSDVPQTLPRRPNGGGDNDHAHHLEWIEACKAGDPSKALSNFAYAGPMTEAVLLGNVALRAGQTVEWDPKALKVTNIAEANRYIRDEYRQGWSL
jgi:predicted dehydrogenase